MVFKLPQAKLFLSIFPTIMGLCLLASCGTKTIRGAAYNSDSELPPTGALLVAGSLSNGKTPSNTSAVTGKEVAIKSLGGETIGSATTDSAGAFSISIAPDALQVGTKTFLTGDDASNLAGTLYSIVSSVPDDGDGKALGINKTIKLTKGNISSKSGDSDVIDLGSNPLLEIGAIVGSLSFADTAVSVQGADVYIPGKSFFVRTGSDGKFHLLLVPPGTYSLRLEKERYTKTVEVVVAANKTTNVGAVVVGVNDRNPLPLSQVLLGSWATKCWDTPDPGTPSEGVLTVNSLTLTSYTGGSCISLSSRNGGAGAVALQEIQVLSDSAIYVIHRIITTGVLEKRLWRITNYTNNQITINTDTGFEVLTRR